MNLDNMEKMLENAMNLAEMAEVTHKPLSPLTLPLLLPPRTNAHICVL
jgi:hypothetical protein